MLIGYPAAFSLAAVGLFFGFIGIELGLIRAGLPRQPDLPAVRHRLQRPAARDPVLHLHGRDPRALRPCRGPARFDRPAVRPGARRPVLCGDLRRRHPRRHHRHGRRLGHRHGRHLAAADDRATAIRRATPRASSPRPAPSPSSSRRRWCWSCWPTSSAARSATCMPARSGRASSRSALFCAWVLHRQHHLAAGRAGAAAGGAHAARLGAAGRSACAA